MRITRYTLSQTVQPRLRLALLTDLHNHPYDTILAQVRDQAPDLIAIAGDVTLGFRSYDRVAGFLAGCCAIAPTWLSLGNHDTLEDPDFAALVADSGAVLLDNRYIDTVIRGVPLRIGGLTSPVTRHHGEQGLLEYLRGHTGPAPVLREPDTGWLPRFQDTGAYKILLCHQPEYYPRYLRDLSIPLVLSGHAHGGQWRIPFTRQGVFAPGQGLLPPLTGGVHDGRLVISRGLSNTTWIPRFCNPREIVLLEI